MVRTADVLGVHDGPTHVQHELAALGVLARHLVVGVGPREDAELDLAVRGVDSAAADIVRRTREARAPLPGVVAPVPGHPLRYARAEVELVVARAVRVPGARGVVARRGPTRQVQRHVVAGDLHHAAARGPRLQLAGQTRQLRIPVHLADAVVQQPRVKNVVILALVLVILVKEQVCLTLG